MTNKQKLLMPKYSELISPKRALTADGDAVGPQKPLISFTDVLANREVQTGARTTPNLKIPTNAFTQVTIDGDIGASRPTEDPTPNPANTPVGSVGAGSITDTGEKATPTLPMSFEEYVLSLKSNADDAYKKTVADAELERRRAAVDARNSYDHARSEYGTKAAALGAMGLSGSGYSEYLDSQAYAQMRGDINAADRTKRAAIDSAETKRANAYANADASFMNYLNQQETNKLNQEVVDQSKLEAEEANKQNAFLSLYNEINAATSESDIDTLASTFGLTSDQISQLKNIRLERIKSYLDSEDYSVDDLKRLLGEGTPLYTEYLNKLKSDIGMIDSSWFIDQESGKLVPKQTAQEKLNDLKAYGLEGAEYEKAQQMLEDTYAISAEGGVTFRRDGGKDHAGKDGNNISVKDSDGTTYHVQYSGGNDTSDGDILKKATNRGLKEGDVFMYENKVYVIVNGKCYGIEKRTNSYGGEWVALVNKLKGNENEE